MRITITIDGESATIDKSNINHIEAREVLEEVICKLKQEQDEIS